MILPRTERRTMTAQATGRPYEIFVASPSQSPPDEGFPVVFLLDANATFGTVVEAIRMRCDRPYVTGVVPALVVGIGYPTDSPYDRVRRTYDFTPPTLAEHLPERYDGSSWAETGGAPAFRDFIERELKPVIEREYPVNPRRSVLMGHSLGSFFVLSTLVERPLAYGGYVAISPSIWWDKDALFTGVDTLSLRMGESDRLSIVLSVGEYEEQIAPWQEHLPNVDQIRRRRSERRMVSNTRELAERLEGLDDPNIRVQYDEFPGEDHASVVPMAISRSLRTVLSP